MRGASTWFQRVLWIWEIVCRPVLYRTLGGGAALLSMVLIWSETMHPFGLSAVSPPAVTGPISEIIAFVAIAYLACCVYIPLLNVRILGVYAVRSGHHSDVPSLLFYAAYMTRLAFPLAWNAATLTKADADGFSAVMGSAKVVSPLLGDAFATWIPIAVAIVTAATLTNLHLSFLKAIGVKTISVNNDDLRPGRGGMEESLRGRALLAEGWEALTHGSSSAPVDVEQLGLLSSAPAVQPMPDSFDDPEFVPLGKRGKNVMQNPILPTGRSLLLKEPSSQPQNQNMIQQIPFDKATLPINKAGAQSISKSVSGIPNANNALTVPENLPQSKAAVSTAASVPPRSVDSVNGIISAKEAPSSKSRFVSFGPAKNQSATTPAPVVPLSTSSGNSKLSDTMVPMSVNTIKAPVVSEGPSLDSKGNRRFSLFDDV
jgi:hypothetical protein